MSDSYGDPIPPYDGNGNDAPHVVENSEYRDVRFLVVLSVRENANPVAADIRKALYRGCEWLDSEDGIEITEEP